MEMTRPPEQIKLFALGSNGSGQLGIGHTEDSSTPQSVGASALRRTGIANIACGGNHSLLLLENGDLLSAGDSEDGRCFSIDQQQVDRLVPSSFSRIDSNGEAVRVKHVTATWTATIAVCSHDMVWVCGTGLSGELGLGACATIAKQPMQVPDFPPSGTSIVKLASCMGHVVAVLSNGEIWGWGKARKGQLGEPLGNVWKPQRVEGIPFFVFDAVCGKDFTCVFGHPSTGELLMLGPTGNDRFGVRKDCPESMAGWKQVAATWGSVLVLFNSGKLSGWGRNDHGQLPPTDLPPLESFAAGSEHCLGVTRAGKVLAWGWGEHGNCGLPTDTNGDVKGRWNEFQTSDPVADVFAGCATSFMVTKAPR